MRHELSACGRALCLRPVTDDDAAFIVQLRSARAGFIHAGAPDVQSQLQWLAEYYERDFDYYFVAERLADKQPIGLISIHEWDEEKQRAEWGRFVMQRGTPYTVECFYLFYTIVFEQLKLETIFSLTIKTHSKAVSLYSSLGLQVVGEIPTHVHLHGKVHDVVEQVATATAWHSEIKPHLSLLLERQHQRQATRAPSIIGSNEEIDAEVRHIVAQVLELPQAEGDITRADQHGWNSVKNLEVLFALEDAFGVVFDEAEFTRHKSASALAAAIRQKAAKPR